MKIEAFASGPFEETNYEVMWQVSLQKYPSPTKITDWRDVSTEMNTSLETSLHAGRASPFWRREDWTPTRSRSMEIGTSISQACTRPTPRVQQSAWCVACSCRSAHWRSCRVGRSARERSLTPCTCIFHFPSIHLPVRPL